MRVLFLTDSLSDLDGVGRYAVRLIRALEAAEPGLEVEILLARKHRPTSASVPAHWRVRIGLPPDYFFYMSPPRFWASAAWSLRDVLPAARRADLVHAVKDYPHSWVASWAARLAGVPCVATLHGTYSVQPLVSPRHRRRANATLRRTDALIAVSDFTRRRVLECARPGAIDPERLWVLPNCVDASHYVEPRSIGERPWHAHPFTLSIGELKERKGLHVALEAWARRAQGRPELHHYVVGRRSQDAYQRRLEEIAERYGVASRVHLLGNVDEEEKVDLLQRAEVFLHTPVTASDGGFEGFGIVYLEASASGTACIGTTGCGAEDAVLQERTGLLAAPEVEPVAEALERLLADDALRRRLEEGGRAHAQQCSWGPNAARVLEIYRRALA